MCPSPSSSSPQPESPRPVDPPPCADVYDRAQVSIATSALLPTLCKIWTTGAVNTVSVVCSRFYGTVPGEERLKALAKEAREREKAVGDGWRQRVAIVTGSNTGIGFITAKTLALANYRVILACRSEAQGKQAEQEIREETGNESVEWMSLDLASFSSIRAFAKAFSSLQIPLHLLINNAGVMNCPFQRTEDGFELQFGVVSTRGREGGTRNYSSSLLIHPLF